MGYDNTDSGALFINDRKEKDTHPDYRGTININGKDYWISAWVKSPRDSSKEDFLSLSVTAKDDNRQQTRSTNSQQSSDSKDFLARNKAKADTHRPQQPPASQADYDSFDEEIPF